MYAQPTPIALGTYNTSGPGVGIQTSGNLQTLGSVISRALEVGAVKGDIGIVGGMVTGSSRLVVQPGGTYILQGHTVDGEGLPVRHRTKGSPDTVSYLIS